MKIPKKVKVGPYNYRVSMDKQVVAGGSTAYGTHESKDLIIRVMSDCHQDQQDETFFHECIHAISFTYGLALEESDVRILGAALTAFLKDNKLLRE